MKFIIPCETYCRLAKILSYFQPDIPEETENLLKCIRLENLDGDLIAIATNQKVAVVERIGSTNQPNGVAHLVVNDVLLNQCKVEKAYNSYLEIIVIPQIATASAKTQLGYSYPANACIFPVSTPLNDWQKWVSVLPINKSNGVMYWNTVFMTLLNETSPSGKISFPKFIDTSVPIITRDIDNSNWVGLFFAQPNIGEPQVEPAVLPDWWGRSE